MSENLDLKIRTEMRKRRMTFKELAALVGISGAYLSDILNGNRVSFKPWNLYGVEYSKVDRWIEDNQETFARAWLDGYEVEKEPLYHVKLTIPGATYYLIQTFLMPGYTHMSFSAATERYGAKWKNTFTESEIKAIDERYWAFAVPVEEAEA